MPLMTGKANHFEFFFLFIYCYGYTSLLRSPQVISHAIKELCYQGALLAASTSKSLE